MKKFLLILGTIFLGLILLLVIFGVWAGLQIGPATKEAKQYARETTLAIATNWDEKALYDRASVELLATLKPGDAENIFLQGARALGDLKSLDEFDCSTNIRSNTTSGKTISSNCTAQAVHQKGDALYTLTVLKRNEEWTLNAFNFQWEATEDAELDI